jgi:hypothetical protein
MPVGQVEAVHGVRRALKAAAITSNSENSAKHQPPWLLALVLTTALRLSQDPHGPTAHQHRMPQAAQAVANISRGWGVNRGLLSASPCPK